MSRIPLIGPRGRVAVLNETPTWVYQTMAAGQTFDGNEPATATVAAEDLDPSVSAGKADYSPLVQGGLFAILARAGRPYWVRQIDNVGNAVLTVVRPGTTETRPLPTTLPFLCGPGECIKALNGVAETPLGILVQLDTPAR